MRTDDDVLRYLDDASRLGLRVGLEYDLGVAPPLRPTTRASLHYVIGAIHQVEIGPGEWIRYDDAGSSLKDRTHTFAESRRFLDPAIQERIRTRTLETVRAGIERDGIDILGHATMGPLAALGDPELTYPAEWQERLISLCIAHDVAIELNEAYGVPHRAFLERAPRQGGGVWGGCHPPMGRPPGGGPRFSVGSDTHFELRPLDRTEEMIRAAALPADRFIQGVRVRTVSDPG